MTSVVTRCVRLAAVPAAALTAVLAATAAPAQEASVLRVLAAENGDGTGAVYDAAVAAFEAAHPDIAVEIELVPWDALFQTLTGALSDGAPPDLAVVGTGWVADLVASGDLEPLDAHMSGAFRASFVPGLLAAARIEGTTWGLPVAASARALYVNTDLLAAAGVPAPPETWDELEAAALAVAATADGVHGFGLQGDAIETDVYFYYALWAEGGAVIEADGSSGLDGPEALAAAERYLRLIDAGATEPDVTASNREDLQALFAAGRLGMMISSPYLAARLAEQAPDLAWTVVPVPAAATRATYGVTDSLVMFAGSPVKDEAWLFAEHMLLPEWHGRMVAAEGFLPVTTAVAESAPLAADPVLSVFTATLRDARFLPAVASWGEIADVTSGALRRIYEGRAAPEEALAAAAAEVDALLGVQPNAE